MRKSSIEEETLSNQKGERSPGCTVEQKNFEQKYYRDRNLFQPKTTANFRMWCRIKELWAEVEEGKINFSIKNDKRNLGYDEHQKNFEQK